MIGGRRRFAGEVPPGLHKEEVSGLRGKMRTKRERDRFIIVEAGQKTNKQ